MKQLERAALAEWNELIENIKRATPVNSNETAPEKKKRVAALEANPEDWFNYYFPHYAYAAPAPFHKAATKRLLKEAHWYEVRAWFREGAKDVRVMFETLYLALTGQHRNVLLVSHSEEKAIRLLDPFQAELENNRRISNDYGEQKKRGKWESGKFTTIKGVSFRAIGAQQNPRGDRNEFARPDLIIITDIDTDESVRNPERTKDIWRWVENALLPTVSISGKWRYVFNGNIIASYSVITEAMKKADYVDIVNIRDEHGKSTWAEKNKEEDIDRLLNKLSYKAQQGEYFNNPILEGTVFKELYYDAPLPLEKYRFLLAYGDPSFKDTKKNDFKAISLVGQAGSRWHVLKVFCEQTSTAQMAEWYKLIYDYVGSACPLYMHMEANATQDLILAQVNEHIAKNNWGFSVTPDLRSKGDKYTRIESLLDPLNRMGNLLFNAEYKENPHMKRFSEQMLAFGPQSGAHDDGPDSLHGAISLAKDKHRDLQPPTWGKRWFNKKRA